MYNSNSPLQKLRTGWVYLYPNDPRRQCANDSSVLNNLLLTIFMALLFLHKIHVTISHPINYAIKKSIVRITARFAPANDCVLFVLLKLVFVALPSGTVWVDVPSPSVVSGVANCHGKNYNLGMSHQTFRRASIASFKSVSRFSQPQCLFESEQYR